MEEVGNTSLNAKLDSEKAEKKLKDKKNTFTLIYILVGLFLIALIAIMTYTFIVTR